MASLTPWTWVWVDSSWWWTGRPGVLWFMGLQRVRRDWVTELNWTQERWDGIHEHIISGEKKMWFQSQAELDTILGPDRYTSCDFVKVSCFFFLLSLIFIFYKREKWHGYCEAENKWYLYSVCHTWTSLVWWLSGKEPTCQCRRHGINPWSEKIPHTAGQLSLSHLFTNTGTTLACTRQTFVSRVMSLLFNTLSRPFIAILPRSEHLGDWEKSIYTFLWLTHESF